MNKLEARNVNVFYGTNKVIKDVSISIKKNTGKGKGGTPEVHGTLQVPGMLAACNEARLFRDMVVQKMPHHIRFRHV